MVLNCISARIEFSKKFKYRNKSRKQWAFFWHLGFVKHFFVILNGHLSSGYTKSLSLKAFLVTSCCCRVRLWAGYFIYFKFMFVFFYLMFLIVSGLINRAKSRKLGQRLILVKKGTKNFTTPYSIPFSRVLQQNEGLYSFFKGAASDCWTHQASAEACDCMRMPLHMPKTLQMC